MFKSLTDLPAPADRRVALRVTPAAERMVREGHPWLFADSITQQSHDGEAGDIGVIFDRKGRFLAVGLYDPTSPMRVRVLQAGTPATVDAAFFRARFATAHARRAGIDRATTDGYRIVHGENDRLPGLVVDRYAETLVVKLYTPAWLPHLPLIVPLLLEEQSATRLVLRLSRGLQRETARLHGLHDGTMIAGPPLDGPVIFRENGLHFEADPIHGQKTGFFLDQRENRQRVEELAAGKHVLNVFAYTGGFSLYAARGGATAVTSLDVSAPALAAADRNFARNRTDPAVAAAVHTTLAADAFDALASLAQDGVRFELIVIDPPAFAKRKDEVDGALAAYRRLVGLGLGVLAPGGTFVMASCSSRVSAELFCAVVLDAAREAGRPLQELARTGHPLDHPIGFAEGAYLKCLYAIAP